MTDTLHLLIDGEYVAAADSTRYLSFSPTTGQALTDVAGAGLKDVQAAVAAAKRAFDVWHRTSYAERRRVLLAAADHLEANAARYQETMTLEVGLPAGLTGMNVGEAAATLREAASLTSLPIGEILPSHDPESSNLSMRVPAGVVLAIVPWNAPLILSARSVAIAIAVGNTVIIKPSEESPNSAAHPLAEALMAAGAPAGVINVLSTVPGKGPEVIEALIAHPHVRRVVFIGSTPVGRKIAALAGSYLKPAVMELGGKNAAVVLEDADLDEAADHLVHAAFTFAGQVCMATDRIIVPDSIADQLTAKIIERARAIPIGDPRDAANVFGPLINERAAESFRDFVADAIEQGATALLGDATTDGLFARPVVLANLPKSARLYRKEAFAPIVSIQRASSEADAIRQANDTELGLMASVLSRDAGHALAVANQLQSGAVHINWSSIGDEPHVPFGGVGLSGMGRLGGMESVRTFTEQRTLYLHGTQLGVAVVKDQGASS